jgi:type I restriction enzyme S subunit
MDRSYDDSAGTVTAFRDGEVVLRSERRTDGFTESIQDSGYQGVEVGDLVVHSMDGFAGAIGVSRSAGKMSPVVHIYTAGPDVDLRFVQYYLRHLAATGYVESLAKGIRERSTSFDPATLADIPIPIPPIEEQRRIADFLDEQVNRIDQIVAAHVVQRPLIEDAFSSIVVELTTVGPEDRPRLRSTGIPWMHTVNENWRLAPARAVLTLRRQLVGGESSAFILLSLTKQGIIRRDVDSNDGKFPASFDTYQEVLPSDLVFCLFDVDETPRTVGLVQERGMLTGAYTRFEVNAARALPEFMYWFYIGVDNHKAFRPLYTGMRKTVQTDRFLSAKIPLPDLDVQHEVVQRLHEARDLTQRQLQAIGELIERLQEYKRSLITAAVTGELHVATAGRVVPV